MAAEQAPGRTCACGCGRPVAVTHRHQKYSLQCRARVDNERRQAQKLAKRENPRDLAFVSVEPRQRHVISHAEPNRRQKPCLTCYGMPSARKVNRYTEGLFWGDAVAVVPPHTGETEPLPVCKGCGEQYAEDAPVERGSVIVSSAGIAVRPDGGASLGFGRR